MAEKTQITPSDVATLLMRVDKEKPAEEDVKRFEAMLQRSEMWRIAGDIAEKTKKMLIANASGQKYLVSRSLEKGYATLKADLGYHEASALERLLIEQILLSWLRHNYVEYQYQHVQGQPMTHKEALYWERKLSQSQRRFLRACESLSKIRKMSVKLQINMGKQQVNVAQ